MKWILLLSLVMSMPALAVERNCSRLFSTEENRPLSSTVLELASIYRNNLDRFSFHNSRLSLAPRHLVYKNFKLKRIENLGSVNAGIFEFTDPNNGLSVLKIYKFPEEKIDELAELKGRDYQPSPKALEVIKYIRGNLLAQDYGAPRMYDSGFIKDEKGEFYFFIQMERIFPDVPFYSVKENAWKRKKNSELGNILRKHPDIIENLRSMATLLADKNIVPFDPDIAIAADGRIRWIDADYWELGTPEQSYISMVEILELLGALKKGSTFSIY
jgi:hypothetical protein